MLSFFGEQCLKDAVIKRVKEHQRLDQIVQGTYWDGVRGCAIGCVLHSGEHMAYETQLGLPVFLAYLDEHIFEALPPNEAIHWPLRFIEAVPVGVDLELIFPRFMYWLLSDPYGARQYADARTMPIIDSLMTMYAKRIDGVPINVAAAKAAVRAAGMAARAAGTAAEAAAKVAWAAAWAARAVGIARAAWTTRAAKAGARAAWAAASAAASAAAEVAAIRRQAAYLIHALSCCRVTNRSVGRALSGTYSDRSMIH